MRVCTKVTGFEQHHSVFTVHTDGTDIFIEFISDSCIRIRTGFDRRPGAASTYDMSYIDGRYSLCGDFLDRAGSTAVNVSCMDSRAFEDPTHPLVLKGDRLTLTVEPEPFRISVTDEEGTVIHEDVRDLAYQCDSNGRRIHTSVIRPGDCFYGFGEKTGSFNKLGSSMGMSPKDAMGYDPARTDSLYKHIPFYIKLNRHDRKAVGYFYCCTAECDFDMGREKSNYWPAHSRFRADSGEIDLFLIAGPAVRDVITRYTDLTGHSAMLPKYALGYLGSSMYYSELPHGCDNAILHFIDTARQEDIPIDGFQLSSGYTAQDTADGERRCVFTWNRRRFSDPADFFRCMSDRGITVSPNVKPGILLSHPDISSFTSGNMLVKSSSSDQPAVGTWWGGKGVFADFTNPEARQRWKKMLTDNVLAYGTDSVWNDNCEYDSLVDKDARCCGDGHPGTIGSLKSVMANIMCRITAEAIREKYPDTRPFIVCRAGHCGIQQYAQTWSGDNYTSWQTLRYNVATLLGMAMSGISNYGCDIGGFYGPAPEPELLVRWVQNGIFQPRFSIHSVNTDGTVTEPWMYPAYTHYIRDAIKLRYRLFPYYYSLMRRAYDTGLPILEPLCSACQADPACYDNGEDFYVGDSLLVANVLTPSAVSDGSPEGFKDTRTVYLPLGSDYYDFNTGRHYRGGQTLTIPVTLASIPMFLPSGAILPMALGQPGSLTQDTVSGLHILFTADRDSSFIRYEDDGFSNDYLQGCYIKELIELSSGDDTYISFTQLEGSGYESTIQDMLLEVICDRNCPLYISISSEDGEQTLEHFLCIRDYEASASGWHYDNERKAALIRFTRPSGDYSLHISYGTFNMLGEI